MTTTNRLAILLSALALLSACGGSEESARPEPPPVEETVFKDMAEAVDKAHSVEDATKQRTEQLNKALEASEIR